MLDDYGKSLFKPWLSASNVVLAFAVVFIVALLKLTSSELASWVQAIGSIVSIWAAFLIGNKQIKKQTQILEQEASNRSAAIYFVVKNAASNAMAFCRLVNEEDRSAIIVENWEGIYSSLLVSYKNSINQLPSYQLGSHALVENYHGVASCVDSLIFIVGRALNRQAFQEQEFTFMRRAVNLQYKKLEVCWSAFEAESINLNPSLHYNNLSEFKEAS